MKTVKVYKCPKCGEDIYEGNGECWCGEPERPELLRDVEIADVISETLPTPPGGAGGEAMTLDEILTELEHRSSAARYIPHLVRLVRAAEKVWQCWSGSTTGDEDDAASAEYEAAVKALEESYGK